MPPQEPQSALDSIGMGGRAWLAPDCPWPLDQYLARVLLGFVILSAAGLLLDRLACERPPPRSPVPDPRARLRGRLAILAVALLLAPLLPYALALAWVLLGFAVDAPASPGFAFDAAMPCFAAAMAIALLLAGRGCLPAAAVDRGRRPGRRRAAPLHIARNSTDL